MVILIDDNDKITKDVQKNWMKIRIYSELKFKLSADPFLQIHLHFFPNSLVNIFFSQLLLTFLRFKHHVLAMVQQQNNHIPSEAFEFSELLCVNASHVLSSLGQLLEILFSKFVAIIQNVCEFGLGGTQRVNNAASDLRQRQGFQGGVEKLRIILLFFLLQFGLNFLLTGVTFLHNLANFLIEHAIIFFNLCITLFDEAMLSATMGI